MYGVVLQVVAFVTLVATQLMAMTQGEAQLERNRNEAIRKFNEENGF